VLVSRLDSQCDLDPVFPRRLLKLCIVVLVLNELYGRPSKSIFGVGPTTYLKMRMLHQARDMLKNSDPCATSVTKIAVGLGIWELGRFSHDYQMLFDELPSETLRHSNAYERLRNRFHLSESSILKICS
jgi:methylphosphotriester-DNA--protein-cysteine methyltransferase